MLQAAGDLCYAPLSRGESFHAEMLLGRKDGTPVYPGMPTTISGKSPTEHTHCP